MDQHTKGRFVQGWLLTVVRLLLCSTCAWISCSGSSGQETSPTLKLGLRDAVVLALQQSIDLQIANLNAATSQQRFPHSHHQRFLQSAGPYLRFSLSGLGLRSDLECAAVHRWAVDGRTKSRRPRSAASCAAIAGCPQSCDGTGTRWGSGVEGCQKRRRAWHAAGAPRPRSGRARTRAILSGRY